MANKNLFGIAPEKRFMMINLFFLFFIMGIYVIMIGSILPMMREEYNLNYQMGGYLISAHNIGNVLAGLLAGFLPLFIGMKASVILVNAVIYIGFGITLITGNPVALIIGIFLTGVGRGGVANYDNQMASSLAPGSAAPLNALHGCFAIGALMAPLLTLYFTRSGNSGWRIAVSVILVFGVISTITSFMMKVDKPVTQKSESGGKSLAFFMEYPFIISTVMMFCYQAVEGSVMGWLVSYYTASGSVSEKFTQLLTSILWVLILIGRLTCAWLGLRILPKKIIRVLSFGIVIFLVILVTSKSFVPMLIATIGLGLSLSGMYGSVAANAGDTFMRYPLAMSFFIFITGMGAIISPSIVGFISEISNIRMGMTSLLVPAAVLLVLAVLNKGFEAIE